MNNVSYIRKWLDGTLSDHERKLFGSTAEFKSLEKLSNATQSFKAPEYNIEAELEKLQIKKYGEGKLMKLSWTKTLYRVAAVLVIIIASFFYFYLNANTSLETLAAQKSSFILPDKSKIELNASTSISYKERLWNISRIISLNGEAYFSVARGSTFEVETSSGTVRVLGTKFNVKSRNDYFEVTCYEGIVEVSGGGDIKKLQPGQSVRLKEGILAKNEHHKEIGPDWINNESSFQSVAFRQVIEEFEIQYAVKVIPQGVNLNQLFTGKFTHADKKLALQSISMPLNLEYTFTDENEIILSGKGD